MYLRYKLFFPEINLVIFLFENFMNWVNLQWCIFENGIYCISYTNGLIDIIALLMYIIPKLYNHNVITAIMYAANKGMYAVMCIISS